MNLLFKELNSNLDNLDDVLVNKLKSQTEENFDLSNLELNQLPRLTNPEFVTVVYIKSRRIRKDLDDVKSQYYSIITNQNKSPNRNSRQKISF